MTNQQEEKSATRAFVNPLEVQMRHENKVILAITELCGGDAYAEDVFSCYKKYSGRDVTNYFLNGIVIFLKNKGYLRRPPNELKVRLVLTYSNGDLKKTNCYEEWKDFVRSVKEKL